MAQILGRHWRSSGSSWTKSVRSPTCWPLVGKAVRGSSIGTWMGKKVPHWGMSLCSPKTKIILIGIRGWHQNGWKEAEDGFHVEVTWWKMLILTSQHHFLTTCIRDALNVNGSRTKSIIEQSRKKFESRISAWATEKLSVWEKPHAKTVPWSYDMEGAREKMRWQVLWQIKRRSSFTQSQLFAWKTITSRRKNWNQLVNCPMHAHRSFKKCLYLARIGGLGILWSINKFVTAVTKWTRQELVTDAEFVSFPTFITQTTTDTYFHVGNTAQHCRVCLFQDSDFAGELEDSKSNSAENLMYFRKSNICSPSLGCARSKRQCLRVPQSRKLFRWMLVCEWTGSLLLVYEMWW